MSAEARSDERIEVEVDGRKVAVSNLDKPMYPSGFTKGQLVDYYTRVAPALIPHVAGRPMTLRRFPEGLEGPTWFQTRCRGKPSWVRTAPVRIRRGEVHDYCLLEDRPSLVWAANLAAIELHPFLAHHEAPDRPLAMVLDLDPGRPAGLAEACRVGLLVRERLEVDGLDSFPKASGSRGIHVHVPLNSPATFLESKSFARALAGRLAREDPMHIVDRMEQAAREGRVLVDWGQNDRRRSIVASYSLRARRRPVVAAPLTWEEVERGIDEPGSIELGPEEVLDRVGRAGDLFAPVLSLRQRL